jgi:hypothetical protein
MLGLPADYKRRPAPLHRRKGLIFINMKEFLGKIDYLGQGTAGYAEDLFILFV